MALHRELEDVPSASDNFIQLNRTSLVVIQYCNPLPISNALALGHWDAARMRRSFAAESDPYTSPLSFLCDTCWPCAYNLTRFDT